jgi:hypothetical protein
MTTGASGIFNATTQPMHSVWGFALHACSGFIAGLVGFKPWLVWLLGVCAWGR